MTSKQPHVGLVLATSTGGVGAHVASLTRYLLNTGHEVTVCGPAATNELFGFGQLGARFLRLEIPVSPSPLRNLLAMAALRRHSAKFDLVHAHGLRAGFVAAAVRGHPLIVTWHNLQLTQGGRLTQLERLLARRTAVAVGVSEDLVARIRALGASDARFLAVAAPPLPAPRRSVDDVRREFGVGARPLILTAARLHPQKSLDVLIAAAARWAGRDPAPLVVIAGDGPQRAELTGLIDRLAAPVRLVGRRDDIADLLAASDIAVLTSQWEARSFFIQEALLAGKPSVVTHTGGLPGLVGDAARLVPVADVAALADAVSGLLDDSAEAAKLAAIAATRGRELPSEDDCNANIAALYAELMSRTQAEQS